MIVFIKTARTGVGKETVKIGMRYSLLKGDEAGEVSWYTKFRR